MSTYSIDAVKIFATCCSILSVISSSSIVLTCLIFPQMRRKIFMRMITIIAFCDMIGCLALSIGFPASSSMLCGIQGAISTFFLRGTFLWTLCFSWQLYSLVVYNELSLYEHQMHLLCWLINITLEFIPLSTNNYGADDGISEELWCFLKGDPEPNEIWTLIVFTLPLLVCIFLMSWLTIRLHCYYTKERLLSNIRVKPVADVLKYYPLLMIICWLPNAIISSVANIEDEAFTNSLRITVTVSLGIGSLYGCLLSILFFANSKEARQRWFRLLYGYRSDSSSILVDFNEIESYEITLRENEQARFQEIHKRFSRTLSRSFSTSTTDTNNNNHDCYDDNNKSNDNSSKKIIKSNSFGIQSSHVQRSSNV